MQKKPCTWPGSDLQMQAYHDTEWGVPVLNDRKLFEFILLDTFQAGLSWKTILHRRQGFKKAFANFDPAKVAQFDEKKIEELLIDESIIRNKLKVQATVTNAKHFQRLKKEYGSFSNYIWKFTGGEPIINNWEETHQIPARSAESDSISKALYSEGFKFVGSTICYAFMQAAGLVNDHLVTCPRHREVQIKK